MKNLIKVLPILVLSLVFASCEFIFPPEPETYKYKFVNNSDYTVTLKSKYESTSDISLEPHETKEMELATWHARFFIENNRVSFNDDYTFCSSWVNEIVIENVPYKYYDIYNGYYKDLILISPEGLIGENFGDFYYLPAEQIVRVKVYDTNNILTCVLAENKDVVISEAFLSQRLSAQQ